MHARPRICLPGPLSVFTALLAACAPPPDRPDSTGAPTSSDALDTTADSGAQEPDTFMDGTGTTSTASSGGAEAGMDTGSSTHTDPDSTSTGPAAPFCGDGIVDDDETCDDMNDDPDDGCKLCTRDRIVFASSAKYQGFALDGLYGADQRCRMLAALAMLPNFGTYRAWLSDSTTAAADRILHSRGRYVLTNGLVVADDWDALVSGTLQHPIDTTEHADPPEGGSCTWTGTLASGLPALGSSSCDDWNGGDDLQEGGVGASDDFSEDWSFYAHIGCGSECAIYCFEN